MRIARKLFLLSALALVATAFAASSASAAVTVNSEATGLGCGTVTVSGHTVSGGCALHANGEVLLRGHVFGIEATTSDCQIEFTGRVGTNGEGRVSGANMSNHAGSNACVRKPCVEAGGAMALWPAHARETGPGTEVLNSEFCITALDGSNTQRCLVNIPISEGADHDYESLIPDVRGTNHLNAPNCEIDGQIHIEGTPVEIVHP